MNQESPEPPTDEFDAIGRLARTVYYIAARCWEHLGTENVTEISTEMEQIVEWARAAAAERR